MIPLNIYHEGDLNGFGGKIWTRKKKNLRKLRIPNKVARKRSRGFCLERTGIESLEQGSKSIITGSLQNDIKSW
jgi:hypothetical protein